MFTLRRASALFRSHRLGVEGGASDSGPARLEDGPDAAVPCRLEIEFSVRGGPAIRDNED
jgi:hypothetical protein